MRYLGKVPTISGQLDLSGTPINLSGTTNMTDNILNRPTLQDTSMSRVNKGSVGTGIVTFDCTGGNVQELTVTGALSIDFSNWAPTGSFGELLVKIKNGNAGAITFLKTINWIMPSGAITTVFSTYMSAIGRSGFQTSGTDFMVLWTDDAGTTIYGKIL